MLAIISPAKSMDFDPISVDGTKPTFTKEANALVKNLSGLSKSQLKKLLSVSDKLVDLNFQRYKDFKIKADSKNSKPAIFAYTGDVYQGIKIEEYKSADLKYINRHLRILSGLYGLLAPLDLIQPYRLEMGTRLGNEKGKDLYEFWGNKITKELNKTLASSKAKHIINLASNEYVKVINQELLIVPMVDIVFKVKKGGKYKVVGITAKRARGEMVQYMVDSKSKQVADLKGFKQGGFTFSSKESSDTEMVFLKG